MKTGILLLNFGEPETPSLEAVVPYLEAIFTANFRLEHAADPEAGRQRARALAERRAPDLVEDYRRMGGSPLRRQTETQARALESELRRRGYDCTVAVGMQFTAPSIEESVHTLREAAVERVVGFPLYPLCGPSTTIFALETMRRAIRAADWPVEVVEISGWHAQRTYTRIRARAVRELCRRRGLELNDPEMQLFFSAHGTPIRYLDEGSRYDLYVRDHCAALAAELDVVDTTLGYQNHANRPDVEWTQPAVEEALQKVDARAVVVVPVSFMQEQSETLVELDLDLRERAESLGLEFHRVPIPHDAPTFISFLADVIEKTDTTPSLCRCRPGAFCFNHELTE
jgi:ferrochelatase